MTFGGQAACVVAGSPGTPHIVKRPIGSDSTGSDSTRPPGPPRSSTPPRPRTPRVWQDRPDAFNRGPARPVGPTPRPLPPGVRRPGAAAAPARPGGYRPERPPYGSRPDDSRNPRSREVPPDVEAEEPERSAGRWFSKELRDKQMAPPKPVAPSEIAARIISRADRQHPADRLLKDELRRAVALAPDNAAWLSRAVFSYYRWRGWLNPRTAAPIPAIVEDVLTAVRLAERFAYKPEAFPDADLVGRVGPEWLSRELELTPELARAWQREPPLWLRCRPGQTEVVATGLRDCAPGPLPDSLRYGASVDLFSTDFFHAGAFEIQDLSSQAVSVLAAPQPGETWWDACAGEGGKTLHLGALMQGKGLVWASDRAEWRLQKLRVRAARAQCFNQRTVLWGDPTRPPTKTRFDGVLVDAPCAGIGTWGRNPHARWSTTPQDIAELATIQTQLLRTAATAVKPGGKLVYSVCTLTRSETTAIADAFGAAHPEFEPLPLVNPFAPAAPAATQLFLWPQTTGGNGMFVAAWRRRPA